MRGSASVELAVALPMIAIALLAIVQVSLLVWDEMRLLHGAREGARVLAVTNDEAQARSAVLRAAAIDERRTAVLIEPRDRPAGTAARISVRYHMPIVVPFMQQITQWFTLRASVEMRVERDPP
ncbi:MAG: hypothetical protein NVSMB57_07600 [Actinomycetota bacterium]